MLTDRSATTDNACPFTEQACSFAECDSLKELVIPDSVIEIGANAFASCSEDLVIICGPDSRAKTYCEENGVAFRAE